MKTAIKLFFERQRTIYALILINLIETLTLFFSSFVIVFSDELFFKVIRKTRDCRLAKLEKDAEEASNE